MLESYQALQQALIEYYSAIKAVHIISIICWMAGLFYLPRLFVYHAENATNTDFVSVVKLQEYRLFAYIMRPAMLFSVFSGAFMIFLAPELFKSGIWFHIKLLFVILLLCYHIVCGILVGKMQKDEAKFSGKFFRVFNEIPTLLMIVIVLCAVIKF